MDEQKKAEIKKAASLPDLFEELFNSHLIYSSGGRCVVKCPFHEEKTPSCVIYEESFYCFGCKTRGDVFTLYEKKYGFTFKQAVKELCVKYGIDLGGENKNTVLEGKIVSLLKYFYETGRKNLASLPKEHPAVEEIVKRGFNLGDFPACFNGDIGSDFDLALQAGLVSRNRFEFFKDRLCFPVYDPYKRIVGFSGRKIFEHTVGGKYVNTPATLVFRKDNLLYGADRLGECDKVIVCEGQFDVEAVRKSGFFAVATMGSVFNTTQFNMITRLSGGAEIVLGFDSDKAGFEAAKRACRIGSVRAKAKMVQPFPAGVKDWCDLRQKFGDSAVRESVFSARPVLSVILENMVNVRNEPWIVEEERMRALSWLKEVKANPQWEFWLNDYIHNNGFKQDCPTGGEDSIILPSDVGGYSVDFMVLSLLLRFPDYSKYLTAWGGGERVSKTIEEVKFLIDSGIIPTEKDVTDVEVFVRAKSTLPVVCQLDGFDPRQVFEKYSTKYSPKSSFLD